MNLEKTIAFLWRIIELLVQVIVVLALIGILLGETAGTVPAQVLENLRFFLYSLPPSSIAVAALIAVYFWWKR